MAKDLHSSIALDDKFNRAIKGIQDGIEILEELASLYASKSIRPVNSQISNIARAARELKGIEGDFDAIQKAAS